jgi:hypothetical protein
MPETWHAGSSSGARSTSSQREQTGSFQEDAGSSTDYTPNMPSTEEVSCGPSEAFELSMTQPFPVPAAAFVLDAWAQHGGYIFCAGVHPISEMKAASGIGIPQQFAMGDQSAKEQEGYEVVWCPVAIEAPEAAAAVDSMPAVPRSPSEGGQVGKPASQAETLSADFVSATPMREEAKEFRPDPFQQAVLQAQVAAEAHQAIVNQEKSLGTWTPFWCQEVGVLPPVPEDSHQLQIEEHFLACMQGAKQKKPAKREDAEPGARDTGASAESGSAVA